MTNTKTNTKRQIDMTEDQALDREERVAIMMVDGGLTERQAHEYCNRKAEIYGFVKLEREEIK